MAKTSTRFSLSLIVGLLAIPVAAIGAVAMTGDRAPEEEATTVVTSAEAPASQQVVFGAVADATADDLAAACGDAGLALVAAEEDGSITDLQQAALDALRPICESQGTALPGKAAPEPITRTITVHQTAPAAPATTATTMDDSSDQVVGSDHDDDHEDHDDEEDHDEDDEHEDHDEDDEDDEHEDDEDRDEDDD